MSYETFRAAVSSYGFKVPNGLDFHTHNGKFIALIAPPKGSLDYSTVIAYIRDENMWEFSINTSVCDRDKIGTGTTLNEAVNDFNAKQNRSITSSQES